MLFRRLLAKQKSETWKEAAEGYAISFITHSAIIGTALFGTRNGVSLKEPDPSYTPVKYLVPKDRLLGSQPKQEHVTWTALATETGVGQLPDPLPDSKALKYVKPKGEAADEEKHDLNPTEMPSSLGDSVMTELQVDSAAVRVSESAAPPYPESMLKAHIEGSVIVQYVVDTTGHADTSSFSVIFATHREFVKSVRNTLPDMLFRPALIGTRRVKQLVQQPFAFRILDSTSVARVRKP